MPRRIYIDGMNVIRTNVPLHDLENRKGVREAQRELVRLVDRLAGRSEGDAEWTVVFDGPGETDAWKLGLATARHSGPVKADDVIVEMAQGAVGMGLRVLIVSNDAEVRSDGAEKMDSLDFYDLLMRREPSKPAGETSQQRARRLVEFLAVAGRVDAAAAENSSLLDELAARLEYLSVRKIPAQKMAKKLEEAIRAKVRTQPNPDPQKVLSRALKEFFGE